MSALLLPHHRERRSPARLRNDAERRALVQSWNRGALLASLPAVALLVGMAVMAARIMS